MLRLFVDLSLGDSVREVSAAELGSKPYQPDAKFVEVQVLQNKTLRFQNHWYSQYPWIH